MKDDLQPCYSSEKVSKVIDIAWFIDPRLKGSFSHHKVHSRGSCEAGRNYYHCHLKS